jgi:hypothetical protein
MLRGFKASKLRFSKSFFSKKLFKGVLNQGYLWMPNYEYEERFLRFKLTKVFKTKV